MEMKWIHKELACRGRNKCTADIICEVYQGVFIVAINSAYHLGDELLAYRFV